MEVVKEENVDIVAVNLVIGIVPGRFCAVAQSQINTETLTVSTSHLFYVMELVNAIKKYEGQYIVYLSKVGLVDSQYHQLIVDYFIRYSIPYKLVDCYRMSMKKIKEGTGLEKELNTREREAVSLILGLRE